MAMQKRIFVRACFITLIALLGICSVGAQDAPATQYLAHNIWYEDPADISSIFYKVGTRIPAGTEVQNVRIAEERGRPLVKFQVAESGLELTVHFLQKYHGDLTVEAFKDRFITTKDFESLTRNMNETETQSIQEGVLRPGMSKEAVLASYGYPPEHKTPTLEKQVWTYWRNRFVTKEIYFNTDGETIRPPKKNNNTL